MVLRVRKLNKINNMIPKRAIEKREQARKWQKTYFTKNPWAKHWMYAKSRSTKRGYKFNISVKDCQLLWMRDKAHLLARPSIDRKNPKFGYSLSNCRFIERGENSRLGNLGRKNTPAQREAGRKNLTGWRNKKTI